MIATRKEASVRRSGERYLTVASCLPRRLSSEIDEIGRSVYRMPERISEIRIRRLGSASIIISGVDYPLFYRASNEEMDGIIEKITGGAMYAHRDTIAAGYISFCGIRVGVSGVARYDNDSLGVGEINSLVFRLGGAECDFAVELYRHWVSIGMKNLLIVAPPSGGKTTAIRSLARLIGSGKDRRRVALIDERGEFSREDYCGSSVDVLTRYRRGVGIELAYRTMNAEVIIVDEIAGIEDAGALISAHGAGALLIATAHATGEGDVYLRECLSPLLERGVFRHGAAIERAGEKFGFKPFFIGV